MSENNNAPQKQTLYGLLSQQSQILAAIEESGGEIEAGIEEALTEISQSLPQKIENYKRVLDAAQIAAENYKRREEEISRVRKNCENFVKQFKNRVKQLMLENSLTELHGESFYFKLSKAKATVDVMCEAIDLPEEFVNQQVVLSIDKDAIKRALDAGQDVPGCKLVQSYSLKQYVGGKK